MGYLTIALYHFLWISATVCILYQQPELGRLSRGYNPPAVADALNHLTTQPLLSDFTDNVHSRLTNLDATQAALDHGHSLLRSLLDSSEKTLPSTNAKGCQSIRQETETAKADYENIITELSQVK